jgi:hypothetical protein
MEWAHEEKQTFGVTVTVFTSLVILKKKSTGFHFRTTNTIYQQLSDKPGNIYSSGIYELKCNTCNKAYMGQSGRSITIRHKEHIRYIRTNNPTSAYAMHILNNRHEYGTVDETLKLLQPCTKGTKMNCWGSLYIQTYRQHNRLIAEQQVSDTIPLYELAYFPRDLQHFPWCSLILHCAPIHTQTVLNLYTPFDLIKLIYLLSLNDSSYITDWINMRPQDQTILITQ